jgi:hypothetical protein
MATGPGAGSPPLEATAGSDVNQPHQTSNPEPETKNSLEAFMQGIAKPAAAAILKTPTKKNKDSR